jgi:hypothetical protein
MVRTGQWKPSDKVKKNRLEEDIKEELQVFANADNPNSIKIAKENGAEGIGLVRVENMNGTSINDFFELFSVAGEMPISIRLLLEDENGKKQQNY